MKNFIKEVFSFLMPIAIAIALVLFIQKFFFYPVTISGSSMYPYLQEGERIIVSRRSEIERFDVIVFPGPDAPEDEYIKRVIGLPGDSIEYKNKILYINGEAIDESAYAITDSPEFTLKELTGKKKVPEGKLFVMGDNRPVSKDSRYFGFINVSDIDGEAVFRFWPLTKWGKISLE